MLVHKESNSLILKLRDPQKVTALVPKARVVQDPEHGVLTQVRFGLDEARVLRNLGIAAPSPIRYFYRYPIKPPFKPFDHQVTTAEFFTLNRRGVCLNDMGCVDASTEYLSPTGWVRIDQYQDGQVAQYLPDTGAIEFVMPTEYVKKPCPEMIRFKTSRGVDQLLSPEHRVLYVSSTGKRMVTQAWKVEQAHAEAAYGWKGRFITTFHTDGGAGLPLTDEQLRLQVAVIADANFPNGTGRAVVRVKKPRKVERLARLLEEAGVAATVRHEASGFYVYSFQAPLRTKEFGEEFWSASRYQLHVIASEVPHWDGSVRKGGAVEFFSTSKPSADFVQYAYSATGRTARITEDARPGRATCYVVHARSDAALLYLTGQKIDGSKSEAVTREPSPDGFKYCFMVPSTFLLLRRNGCVFATGNTGKTLSVLWAMDYLMEHQQVQRAVIVCPKSTVSSVWEQEVFDHFLAKRTVNVLTGSKDRRLKLLAQPADIYVVNHDGLKVIEKELRKRTDIDLWVIDEAAAFRNSQSQRHKLLADLVRPTDWLWLLTGTPCPQEPTDAWGLAKLMHGRRVQPPYFRQFKEQTMLQLTEYKWVPKPDAFAKAYAILQPGIRFKKEDCLDLPDVTFQTLTCALSPDQQAAYKAMITTLVANVRGVDITAANAAVKMQKLLQVCVGSVYDEHGSGYDLDASERLKLCEDLVEQAGHKVIVFVPFTHALDAVANHLRKRWTVAVVDGRTTDAQRRDIFRDFQQAADPHVLVAHPQTTAHGLTLTRADHTIWYAPIPRLEVFEQANNRMNRPGQKHKMTISMLAATTLEQNLYQALKGKQDVQNAVLSLFKAELGLNT